MGGQAGSEGECRTEVVHSLDITVGFKKQKNYLNVYMLKVMYIYTCVCALICDSIHRLIVYPPDNMDICVSCEHNGQNI